MIEKLDPFLTSLKSLYLEMEVDSYENKIYAISTYTTLIAEVLELKQKYHFSMLLDIVPGNQKEKELSYILFSMKYSYLFILKVRGANEQIPTLIPLFQNAKELEEELSLRNLYVFENTDFKTQDFSEESSISNELVFGPYFPYAITPMKFSLSIMGERIVKSKVSLGYTFKDFEARYKHLDTYEAAFLLERLTENSSYELSFLFMRALEEANGITIPERAQALRMLSHELVRIFSHVKTLKNMFDFAHFAEGATVMRQVLSTLLTIFEKWTTSYDDSLKSFNKIGGVAFDMPQGWPFETMNVLRTVQKMVLRITDRISGLKFWMDLCNGASISSQDALSFAISGVALKSLGINFDLRKRIPYYFYKDLSFDIPLASSGQTYDRYLVLSSEILESLKIVFQLLDYIPSGEIFEKIDLKDLSIKKDHYSFIESHHGHLGIFLSKDKGIKIRSSDLPLCHILSEKVEGLTIDQFFMAALSLNIDTGQIDR